MLYYYKRDNQSYLRGMSLKFCYTKALNDTNNEGIKGYKVIVKELYLELVILIISLERFHVYTLDFINFNM